MGHDAIISDHTERLIACKAGQICRRQEFGAAERDDVQQDLWLHLMTKAHYFDPQRGSPHAFVERVVCSGVSVILRQRRRQRRLPWSQAISLEGACKKIDGRSTPIREGLSQEDLRRRLGTSDLNDVEAP